MLTPCETLHLVRSMHKTKAVGLSPGNAETADLTSRRSRGMIGVRRINTEITAMTNLLIEYTDTYGGEANYSWVKREVVDIPDAKSDRAVMRLAKRLMGLSGVQGRTISYGDLVEFRPYRSCTVMFIQVCY